MIDFNTGEVEPFYKASIDVMGQDNVYPMLAFGKLKDKAAYKTLARARGINFDLANTVSKDLDQYRNHPDHAEIIKDSEKFVGVIDSASIHPCSYLLLDKDIKREVGVVKVGDHICAVIDSTTSDKWKYLKNDLLKVDVYALIAKTCKVIGIPIPTIRELRQKLEANPRIWDLYELGLTQTLNQATSEFAVPLIKQYKPKSVREMSAWVAAIRPAFGSLRDIFLNRQPYSYGIPAFDKILETSDNFVLYQENIMATLVYAGFPEDETYGILKAISKKKPGIIEKIHDRFIKGFTKKTGDKEAALKVWQIIEDAVAYGFNSSHSLSVAYDSLYGAWLKTEYPLEYFTVVLDEYSRKKSQMAQVIMVKCIQELPFFNINLMSPEFGRSQAGFSFDRETRTIYKGISSIKYLNEKIVDELNELYENRPEHVVDLLAYLTDHTSLDTRQIGILIKLNYFKEYGPDKKISLFYEEFKGKYKKNYVEKTKKIKVAELKEIWANTPDIEFSVSEKASYQYEYARGIDLMDPKFNPNLVIITKIHHTKFKSKNIRVTVQRFIDGKSTEVYFKRDILISLNINDFDVVLIKNITRRNRVVKQDGKWIELPIIQKIIEDFEIIDSNKLLNLNALPLELYGANVYEDIIITQEDLIITDEEEEEGL